MARNVKTSVFPAPGALAAPLRDGHLIVDGQVIDLFDPDGCDITMAILEPMVGLGKTMVTLPPRVRKYDSMPLARV
ncbi:hypothetical protein CCP4SC76_4860001 [Gammaproteobacteria bacterium]